MARAELLQRSALVRRDTRGRNFKAALCAGVSVIALVSVALANPQGGEVVSGSATISTPAPNTTQINQQSDKAILNWQSFNIKAGETTTFVQPGATSIALNRIFDANPTVVAGVLSANGRLILINRNGMVFESGAKIDTAGLVATTADITNENFQANKFQFDIAGNPNASITNAGAITARPGGLVAIVAPSVENSGVITAKLGRIGLGAATTFTLDLQGENLVSFTVTSEMAQQLAGAGVADGSSVRLSSAAARSVIDETLKVSGDTIANSVEQTAAGVRLTGPSGKSWLTVGGATGTVTAGGTLDVSGPIAGSIALAGANVLASGRMNLDAAYSPGGHVSIVADNVAALTGSISARGVSGGVVDVAARNILSAGRIDLDAAYGGGGRVDLVASESQIATSSANISANGVTAGGSINVQGGSGLFSSGTYSATASAGQGGNVAIGGRDIKLIDAQVDASGASGGGSISVGFTGEGAARQIGADNVLVSPTSTFSADATQSGDGGSVTFWSNLATDFMGTLTAKGGSLAGDGGMLEVSSKGDVGFWGLGDASAAHGVSGKLSLDPKNIVVSSTGSTLPSYQLIDPNLSAGDLFGGAVAALSTGNTVVTASGDDFGASNAGAVYVFNTTTGALLSTLTGSRANDGVGSSGITVLSNGNFVVASPNWDLSGAIADAGAVTWGSGTTGVSGAVSSANSLVGVLASDQVGSSSVTALTNGNYVVASANWDNGGTANVGAVTWGNGATGTFGSVTTGNSLFGSSTTDNVGSGGVTALSNGNYVVRSTLWNNGATTDVGAVTWRSGASGTGVAVSSTNSLIGSAASDQVGSNGVIALTNGNYVVASSLWNNGATTDAGAVTWVNGTTGATSNSINTISSANSLVGTAASNLVGNGTGVANAPGAIALSNGNYVAISSGWDNGGTTNVGAVTWGNGTTGTAGNVATGNSLVGVATGDAVGSGGVFALTNGNYVVSSPLSDQGSGGSGHGAVTWASGTAATSSTVTTANSLVGATAGDNVGNGGVVALTNGNYVVISTNFDAGTGSAHGAVTWRSGAAASAATVSSANSLVGVSSADNAGSGGVRALTNGNYVVSTPNFDGGFTDRGAVTWGSGTTGVSGQITTGNSYVGAGSGDLVGSGGSVALTDGNYLILSPSWDGAGTDRGAVTWANGAGGATTIGTVGTGNSIYGSTDSDQVGGGAGGGATALAGGNYVISSPLWNNGATADTGAVTLGYGGAATGAAVATTNSIVGGAANAQLIYAATAATGEILARSSASSAVFVGLTDPSQVTFTRGQSQTLTVNPAFLTRTLNTGTAVALQASNDLTISSDIIANNPSGNGGALTLQAGRSVLINADITTDNGNLTIVANELLSAGLVDAQRDAGAAVLTMGAGADIAAGTGNVRLTIASGAGKTNTTSGDMTLRNVSAGTIIAENLGPSNGNVVIASGALTASGSGTPLVVASQGGNFVNSSGAGALSAAGGRWLVYSQNPGANTLGGLSGSPYYNTPYNSAAPTALSATGSRFAYTVAPVLTVTPNNQSRAYGDANPTLTYAVTGLVGSDTLGGAASGAPNVATTANASSTVAGGPYAINASLGTLASDYNYGFAFGSGLLTVNAATLSYAADPVSRLYGDANPAFTGTVTGFKNGDTIATATTGTLAFTSAATITSNVGAYTINGSGLTANSGNYVLAQAAANATALTINPATLLYAADAASRLYGDANPAFTGNVTGFKNGQTVATATTGTMTFTSPATATTNVGGAAVNGSGLTANNGNYVFGQAAGNATALTINPSTLTYVANSASRLYGDANPAFGGSVTGFKNGQTVATATTGTLAFTSPALATDSVGTYGINGSGLAANNGNYVFVQAASNAIALTINPATLLYAADPVSRLYGDANPAFTGTVTGFKNSDTIATATTGTLSFTSAATVTSNVGSYAITGSGLTANSGNYVLAQAAANATALTINPATLLYTADAASRLYGDANPAFTGAVTGFKNGETVATATTGTTAFTSPATAATNVGAAAINGSGLAANNGNYTFAQAGSNATALTIDPSTLTYVANSATRLYGDANPAFSGSVTGFKNGQTTATATTGTLAFTSTALATDNVGTYGIDGSGLVANNGNYLFVQAGSNASALTIDPATLLYTADPVSRLYGDANPALTGVVTGFKNGETIATATTGTLAFDSDATVLDNVGSYAIDGSGLTANFGNYLFAQAATNATALSINPATLTYTADAKSRLYGDANPALTGTVTGFKNGEDIAGATTGTASFDTAEDGLSNVGSYAINGSGLTANNGNYLFVQAAANATALTIDPATLTYVADAQTRLYGDADPLFTGTVTGFKNSQDLASATTGALTFGTPAVATSNVGSYAIDGSGLVANNGNYIFAQAAANGTALTIDPSILLYVADPVTRLYGDANPALTGVVTGFKNGETIATATAGTLAFTTSASAGDDVGGYTIDGSGLTANFGNYVFDQHVGNALALTINPATLTYVADSKSRLYGDANPALTGTVTGFKNGEDLAGATTGALAFDTAAIATDNVGSYGIFGSGLAANDGNYVFVQDGGNATALTINPSTLTYVADAASRLYGDANPLFSGTVTGFKNGEDLAGATAGTLAFDSTAIATTGVGAHAIDGSGLTANFGNYVFAQAGSNATALTIDPATLTYIADPGTREYGDADPLYSGTVTGFKNSETIGTATTGTLAFTGAALATSPVGSHAINGGGLAAANYVFAQDPGNATALTITAATLTYVADPKSRLYGDANPALTGTVAGFKNGETIATATTGALAFNTGATVTDNVGSYAIAGSGLTANNGNYLFVQAAANATALTINPATLLYVADAKTRLYGDANPALTGAVTGFKNGESVGTATTGALAFNTTAIATTGVGAQAIDGSGLSANFGNYVFAQAASNATALTINPATLTYVADPGTRLYGDPDPAYSGTVTGFKNSETIGTATTGTLAFTGAALATSPVGAYAINGSGLAADNYVFAQDPGNATALTITPATLTYIADPKSRLYGDANPALTGTVTGFKNSETIATATTGALAFNTTAVATDNVGSYGITGSGLTANNGNYLFVQAAANATALTINPATLLYVADAKTRLYGDANPALTGAVTGFKNGETQAGATTGALAFNTTATATTGIGGHAIDGSGLAANFGNYVFAQAGSNATALTINPATLSYLANPGTRLYGDPDPVFSGTVTGFKNSETIGSATTGTLAFTGAALATSPVGSYAINGSGLAAANYVFAQDPGNATALTITPAMLTYVADPKSRLYGDANPALTGTVTGFKNSETMATATTGALAFNTGATATDNVGSYAIAGSGLTANNGNYLFVQAAANATALSINPATLLYVADAQTRLYGDANPALTGTVTGFKNGETVGTATTGALAFSTTATATTGVGGHAIDGSGLAANFGNYVFAQAGSNATALTINPATLAYVANPGTRLYGDPDPAYSGSVTGFKNGETVGTATTGALAFTSAALATSPVGTYAINGSGLAAVNYVFVQDPGNATALAISPATLTYLADPKSRLYGDANPALTGSVTGFKNGETVATATTGALAFNTTATVADGVGSYGITGSGLAATNYVFVQDASNATALTINPAGLLYVADPKSRLYGDANPALTGTVTGFKNGDTQGSATTGALTFTTSATAGSNVGSNAITGTGLVANANYVLAQAAANSTALTITPSTLTYLANTASRLYGDANPAFSGSVNGFKNGETQGTATTGALAFTSPAGGTAAVGQHAINGSGLAANNGNYLFAQDAANATALTINAATLTYVADPKSRLYGDANPALTGAVTGFKNGETAATATTGALAFSTTATAANNVGTYSITGGGLSAGNYVFVQDPGNATALTINPATLTYLADSKTRIYGDANPALTGTVTGFKNSDTIGTATTGALTFATTAAAGSNVGTYGITGSGLSVVGGNYVMTQAASNASAFHVTAATLFYVADPASRLFGEANPVFTGTVTGFKNADTLATATTGTAAFTSPTHMFQFPGNYAINGSGLGATSGNYVFAQDPGNATALTILDNPNALPLSTLTQVDKEGNLSGDGVHDPVDGAPSKHSNTIDVGGTKGCAMGVSNVPNACKPEPAPGP